MSCEMFNWWPAALPLIYKECSVTYFLALLHERPSRHRHRCDSVVHSWHWRLRLSHAATIPDCSPRRLLKQRRRLSGACDTCSFRCCILASLSPAVFQAWRGIGAAGGLRGGWTQGWTRCLRWDSDGQKAEVRIFNYPVWLVRCRGGRARLVEVYQKGRGAIRLPTDMLSLKLPQLLDIHQVPKVRYKAGWRFKVLLGDSTDHWEATFIHLWGVFFGKCLRGEWTAHLECCLVLRCSGRTASSLGTVTLRAQPWTASSAASRWTTRRSTSGPTSCQRGACGRLKSPEETSCCAWITF